MSYVNIRINVSYRSNLVAYLMQPVIQDFYRLGFYGMDRVKNDEFG